MKINKKGFTLGEVLVCIMIIGIIMALSMQSIKMVKSSYTSLTYFALKNVQDLVGEIYSGETLKQKLLDIDGKVIDSTTKYCKDLSKTEVNGTEKMVENGSVSLILKPDRPVKGLVACNKLETKESPTNTFCNALVALANTAGDINCTDLKNATVQYSSENNEPYIHIEDYKKPTFITTNGMRYYLTAWNFDENVSKKYGFRLLAVDLNGESKPNLSGAATNSQLPDIVTFLILDNAEVLPLGVAADNVTIDGRTVRYLNSKVKGYYYIYNSDRKENIPPDCFMKKDGKSFNTCNYAVVNVKNESGESFEVDKDTTVQGSFFTYRQAYCGISGENSEVLTNYCDSAGPLQLCPPSTSLNSFDLCLIENVKPMFRYNLK